MAQAQENEVSIIGWTIIIGNPVDGLSHYGFYESAHDASEAASHDKMIGADWWIAPIYANN
jgi:hypothetical protein